jgi:hypothetical protein
MSMIALISYLPLHGVVKREGGAPLSRESEMFYAGRPFSHRARHQDKQRVSETKWGHSRIYTCGFEGKEAGGCRLKWGIPVG